MDMDTVFTKMRIALKPSPRTPKTAALPSLPDDESPLRSQTHMTSPAMH